MRRVNAFHTHTHTEKARYINIPFQRVKFLQILPIFNFVLCLNLVTGELYIVYETNIYGTVTNTTLKTIEYLSY